VRALIVDDEAPARSKLRRMLGAAPDVEIVGEAATGAEAVAGIRGARPDVVFLDVQMPEFDGFAVIDEIGTGVMPFVVFVTASDEHAVRAFEVEALDYLLKPFAAERLAAVLDRVRAALSRGAATVMEQPKRLLRRLIVEDERRAVLLAVERIDWFEAAANYVRVHVGGATYQVRGTLAKLAERLDGAEFLRINRSEIVRLDAVREMHPWSHGDYRVVLVDGTTLTWSRRYRAAADLDLA
jgi:two-component system, LytTR family, response regulator